MMAMGSGRQTNSTAIPVSVLPSSSIVVGQQNVLLDIRNAVFPLDGNPIRLE
jgi:hypothetical protein